MRSVARRMQLLVAEASLWAVCKSPTEERQLLQRLVQLVVAVQADGPPGHGYFHPCS